MNKSQGFHFINVVWGQDYTKFFLDFSLPTQLSQGNLLAFRSIKGSVYTIYTTPEDAKNILKSPVYSLLSKIIETKIKVFTTDGYMGTQGLYRRMNLCHQASVLEANQNNSIMVILYPDSVWSDGSFAKLIELSELGKRAVLVASYRTNKETLVPQLINYSQAQKESISLSINARDLVKISLSSLHPITDSLFSDSQNFSSWPSHIYWRVDNEGFLARCFHLHPLMINPQIKNILPKGTVDGEFISQCIPDISDVYIVDDSDELTVCEVSNLHHHNNVTIQDNTPINISQIREWVPVNATLQHRFALLKKIRIHTDKISDKWQQIENDSDKIIDQIVEKDTMAEELFNLAASLTAQNEFEKSLYYWRQGLEFCADIQKALFYWVDRATFNHGKIEEAIKLYKIVYEVQKNRSERKGSDKLNLRFLSPHWASRIGHLAFIDYYIKMGILGWRPLQHTILLASSETVSSNPLIPIVPNSWLLNYWRNYIEIVTEPELIEVLYPIASNLQDHFNVWVVNDEVMEVEDAISKIQKQWEFEGRQPLLHLSDADHEWGWKNLKRLGMNQNSWFVCLQVRDSGYWGENYTNYRNADINTYLLAIQSIVEQGGWVIRMGDPTMKPLPSIPHVIDYAHSKTKSDRMDVFLCVSCRFFIGTCSGLSFLPSCFGVPVAMTNLVLMRTRMFSNRDIYIPKMYWSISDEQYVSFAEAMAPPLGHAYSEQGLSQLGIKLVNNTPDEINDLVLEMLDRLNSTVIYTKEDNLLQAKFDKLADTFKCFGFSRIGRDFLRKYAKLLP